MRNFSTRRPLSYAQSAAEKCAFAPENRRSSETTFTPDQLLMIKQKKNDEGLTFALQALLDRHESFVKDARAEQARSAAYIVELELERADLQANNESIRIENRDLLDKLEQADAELGAKDERVKELENLLQDCENEVTRLNGLRNLTLDLEHKLEVVERDRAEALQEAQDCRVESRSTIARWRESERKIRELEKEVCRIELKANADLQRHEDIVARLSRGQDPERSLGLSEGRLKPSAAVQTVREDSPREKQVVSNFVRDILQDNVNLQAGIAELRQLLATSNEEVQTLRERVILHQPIMDESPMSRQSLDDEIAPSLAGSSLSQQQVHVHHHYHPGTKRARTPLRRAKQRRVLMPGAGLSSRNSTSSSVCSTPSMRPTQLRTDVSLPPFKLEQPRDHRWSIQSSNTASTYFSSIASSPHSYLDKGPAIFDRSDCGNESSRPTSPDLSEINSPLPYPRKHRETNSSLSAFIEEDEDISPSEVPFLNDVKADCIDTSLGGDNVLCNTQEDRTSSTTPSKSNTNSRSFEPGGIPSLQSDDDISGVPLLRDTPNMTSMITAMDVPIKTEPHLDLDLPPSHRRRNSTDSLVSISGMDIHIAQRPRAAASTALALLSRSSGANKHHFAPSPVAAKTRQISGAAQPSAVVTEVAAVSRSGVDNVSASMMALSGIARERAKPVAPSRSSAGLFGGWISRKWGVAPAKSIVDLRSAHSSSLSSAAATAVAPETSKSNLISQCSTVPEAVDTRPSTVPAVKPKTDPSLMRHLNSTTTQSKTVKDVFGDRSPGINQLGAIPGLAAMLTAKASPVVVNPERVDVDELRDGLSEI